MKKVEKVSFSKNYGVLVRSIRAVSVSLLCALSGVVTTGCDSDDDEISTVVAGRISGVSLPSIINMVSGSEVALTGKGFEMSDVIVFTSLSGERYLATTVRVSDDAIVYILPDEIPTGQYTVSVESESANITFGTITLNVEADTSIDEIEGMTIKGMVSCEGKGVAGVVVSDGVEVTTTNENGIYYLPSAKETGMVFISVPSGYEVNTDGNNPMFYQTLSNANEVDRKDFSIVKCENNDYVLMAFADMHLANRNNDLSQFTSGFLRDVNSLIEDYKSQGKKVYGLTLGDQSWDQYWYSNKFAMPNAMEYISKIDCTVFNCMGNHDNDPYDTDDWLASLEYRENAGPTYYSFNIGKVHYVVLDDIQYLNTGASDGVIGERNYNGYIVAQQLEWLKKDLATLTDKSTPIVVAMHIPLHSNSTLDANGNQVDKISLRNGSDFLSVLEGYTNVRILSGHTHINYTGIQNNSTVKEWNIGAVCATWWWTGKSGYADNHICKDGAPGGYGVLEVNGPDMTTYYKSIGFEREYQFRTYDLNEVYISAAEFAPNASDEQLASYVATYGRKSSNNEVLINVWSFGEGWKVEVEEDGKHLEVKRVAVKDPLHIISYEAKRLDVGSTPTASFVTCNTAHMFKVAASSATSTLSVKVTDNFGRVYTETMARPKKFDTTIK